MDVILLLFSTTLSSTRLGTALRACSVVQDGDVPGRTSVAIVDCGAMTGRIRLLPRDARHRYLLRKS